MIERKGLNEGIRRFYDASSGLWEEVWGEHMHHGYWEAGEQTKDRRLAQVDLIVRLIDWAAIGTPTSILDVGCGIGGSSLYLAERFGAQVRGITLSPVQCARAQVRAAERGLQAQAQFSVADAHQLPFADASFDLVWSLESGEHMADKAQFLGECYRVLKPGGQLLFVTWCCRHGELTAREQSWLAAIYRIYHLPYILSIESYADLLVKSGFQGVQQANWSERVARFWSLVIDSALDPAVFLKVIAQGPEVIKGALAMQLMRRAYAKNLLRFGVFTAYKGTGR
ncbi:methyltransferase domain-containing protein [Gloeobacter kilaueensis]|uniref:Ubiquinone/menaquinone biosynthesis methyltransferase n=1 Tax=Gloeobacter kilaueensis (strain ATCC BAA-2537 / CCAP 1431/1 / ULC 316 / JS1) TaxID=1183438 RepID=U5QHA9_GLOK1|nr:methyltransferase domain-containing protein [Gloeobacter kilaueensis]AGY57050.1 ubiquinone/menaquinone biosynthesis methyltransferase [Gloeobacter kilaueensis JS1]